MPMAPLRPCAAPGCPALVSAGRCPTHAQALERARPNRDVRRWYFTAAWRSVRRQVLDEQPLCVECGKQQRITPAVDVDHIVPYEGDYGRFIDRTNLQGLCKLHHTLKTRAGL